MEYMNKQTLSHLIDSAMHRIPADLVIFNCNIVDVYTVFTLQSSHTFCHKLRKGIVAL